ncbi:MAG TPA: hypothetical protein DCQ26_14600 [Marinilabiliales bacterium]|jgi:tRNA C32,U32 (ribose-2'-O)-methylase TrmJ|nr:MAG: hypothetical protein A2W95_09885 [Bacteroidetes bacterium GWA2_40_14]OFX57424.1 MAG: hypothetical protein A2W84_08205 [Bacteroidetes bacterium GWC2_40_13]OFX72446.1 MAG: hypothetical protein A2W96_05315 [Bacteroidetes bacterium GWD2_40_43]OFX95277.1 MAG: hypothetical protein A2W97_06965 [Bacteroidetes bacterium GWE2_40_63]OFY21829.1 MAG: hypothetical protein A2W88_13010 [Bacteroidetes bacterium GWF2_40_13]OFZ26159.1 MAG: hypothetical protein A2437_02435 [Bacteroidetes bacterium RIFOXYC
MIRQKENDIQSVGFVYGRIESGLTNGELNHCDLAVTIPLKPDDPSFSLAQAAMTLSHVFSGFENYSLNKKNNPVDYSLIKGKVREMFAKSAVPTEGNLHGKVLERQVITIPNGLKFIL